MRGTALVVLLCLFAALAAHTLAEEARAQALAADELCQPGEADCDGADEIATGPKSVADAPAVSDPASKQDAAPAASDVALIAP